MNMSLVDRDGSEKAPVLLKSVTFYVHASTVTPLPAATMHVTNISTLLYCKPRLCLDYSHNLLHKSIEYF